MPREDILKNSEPRNALLPEHAALLSPLYVKLYNEHIVGTTLEHQVSLETYRENPEAYTSKFPAGTEGSAPEIGCEEDISIPVNDPPGHIKVKTYRPVGYKERKTGVFLYFHGGGWVLGSSGEASAFFKSVVDRTGCAVFDVDYRLAPEHKFPVPLTDSWAALEYIHKNAEELGIDTEKIVVGGISAGAHISIYLTHRAREAGIKISYGLFIVPAVDANVMDENFELREDCPYPSWNQFYDGPFLSYHRTSYFYRHFLPPNPSASLLRDPMLSPIHAQNLQDLPPCLIMTAEVDVLRDEGKAYYEKLKENGVDAEYKEFKGVTHPFMGQTKELPQVQEFWAMVMERLGREFSK